MLKGQKIEDSELIGIFNRPEPIPRKVPDYMRRKGGAWYWTGAMVMVSFMYEVLTGLILLFYYQPSNAYASTENFLNSVPFGSLILTTHLYGAYAMIVFVYIHLLRNLFVAAYKKPRKNQWFSGVILLITTLGVGFFGYSMSGDVLSADATDVGRGISAAIPFVGDYLKRMFFGNGTPLSLFHWMLGWHIVLAAGIGVIFGMHFFLSERNTIMPHRSASNYQAPLIDKEDPQYKPWYPYNLMYMGQIALLTIAAIMIIPSVLAILPHVPALLSPFPQVSPSSPLAANVPSYPPWFLLFVYKAMDFQFITNPFWNTVVFAGMPLIYLLLLPYIDTGRTMKMTERPVTVSFGIIGIFYLVGLSIWGALTPGLAIPDSMVLEFFLGIGASVFLIVQLITRGIRSGKIKIHMPQKLYTYITLSGFSAFGTGALLVPSIVGGYDLYQIPEILLAMATALLVILSVWHMYSPTRMGRPNEDTTKRLNSKIYVVVAGFLTMAAIVILFIISGIPPTSPTNSASYGIGLGILFIIAATMIRVYRAAELGE